MTWHFIMCLDWARMSILFRHNLILPFAIPPHLWSKYSNLISIPVLPLVFKSTLQFALLWIIPLDDPV
jgi:hypothetical protein